jgi:hypothetical protein
MVVDNGTTTEFSSTMSGFFGLRQSSNNKSSSSAAATASSLSGKSKTNLSARYSGGGGGSSTIAGCDDEDVSIFSILPDRTSQIWGLTSGGRATNINNNGSKKKKQNHHNSNNMGNGKTAVAGGGNLPASCAASMMSDISSTTNNLHHTNNVHYEDDDEDEFGTGPTGAADPFAASHEFLIQCKNGEMVFVPSNQGKAIKTRCRHFKYLLGLSIMTTNSSTTITTTKTQDDYIEDRIVKKESWSIGTARHIIELLTQGTTWIPNDYKRFEALKNACKEIDIPGLCLGSMINYHDILDQASTLKFFELASATHKYQFQFCGVVQSWQWMYLLHKDILLLPKKKSQQVLMLTVAPPTDGTKADLPTSSSRSTKIVTKLGGPPNHQRLAICDELCSEFSVYSGTGSSSGSNKIQALLLILNVLSKGRVCSNGGGNTEDINGGTTKESRLSTSLKKVARHPSPSSMEEYKIVYKTHIGGLSEQDLNMMWRLTSASYTIALPEERRYLVEKSHRARAVALGGTNPAKYHGVGDDENNMTDTNHTRVTEVSTSSNSSSHDEDVASFESVPSSTADHLRVRFDTDTNHEEQQRYQIRTITGNSFMILRHLFEPVNSTVEEGEDVLPKHHSRHQNLKSCLPASLILYDPTPDTLGRFLNAAATVSAMNSSGSIVTDIGWDFLVPPSLSRSLSFIFFFSGTSDQVHQLLEFLADYSRSAIVEGLGDFNFNQRT